MLLLRFAGDPVIMSPKKKDGCIGAVLLIYQSGALFSERQTASNRQRELNCFLVLHFHAC